MPGHDIFYVIFKDIAERNSSIITVLHEVPDGAAELASFSDPGEAIDFAQDQVRRMTASGRTVIYVDPPDDLVGTG